MSKHSNSSQFLRIIQAFQHFAGKSLAITDCADSIDPKQLDDVEFILQIVAQEAKAKSQEFPDLGVLSMQIKDRLEARY